MPDPAQIHNVILDWSGTLADDLPPVLDATNRVLEHFGAAPLGREEFRREFCLPFTDFYARVLPGVALEALDPLYVEYFDASAELVEELPGARRFLDHCSLAGRRLFLLSSVKTEHFERQALALGFRDYFEHPYTAVLDKRVEIRDLLSRHGLAPGETAFAGDMIHDIETARHGGVMSVATLTGYDSREELETARPDVIVEDLSALIGDSRFSPRAD